MIVHCPSPDVCSSLYALFNFEASYYPPAADHISDNRLFGMFHANTRQHQKDIILQSLLHPGGVVRVVFATMALGMGVNMQNVNTIIHYGAPKSVDRVV